MLAAGQWALWEGFGVFGVVGRAGLEMRCLITNRIPWNDEKDKGRMGKFVEKFAVKKCLINLYGAEKDSAPYRQAQRKI